MQKARPTGYILVNKVTHARFLPTAATHAFVYPTVAFLLPLGALERNELDVAHGWLFGYGGLWGQLTGIRPSAYLHDYNFTRESPSKLRPEVTRRPSIRDKLCEVLNRYGHDPTELQDAWMLTTPSYLGFEGINPLTVYYCYKKLDPNLWIVVLEVHNTFGERHVYALPTGLASEDKDIPPDFTHSWTFPRQFHVSPFNDRSGYYKCSIVAPWRHPSNSWPTPESTLPPPHGTDQRHPTVQIHLYTTQPSQKLKLTAVLRPTSAVPLTLRSLLSTFLKFPLSLFLTFPRIAYEAFRLHYHKRLNVYVRPEPRAVDESVEQAFSSDIDCVVRNPVQPLDSGNRTGNGGGVGWQPEGMLERYARHRVEEYLCYQTQTQRIHITLVSSNPAIAERHFRPSDPDRKEKSIKRLIITFRAPRYFIILLTAPSPQHALLIAKSEGLGTVSDEGLFTKTFSTNPSGNPTDLSKCLCDLAQKARLFSIPPPLLPYFFPSHTTGPHVLDLTYIPSSGRTWTQGSLRPLYNLLVILTILLLTRLEQVIFTSFRARFVPGDEPWLAWSRAEEAWTKKTRQTNEAQGMRQRIGSTLRPSST